MEFLLHLRGIPGTTCEKVAPLTSHFSKAEHTTQAVSHQEAAEFSFWLMKADTVRNPGRPSSISGC